MLRKNNVELTLNQQLGRVIDGYRTKILYVDVYDLLDNIIAATKAGQSYVVAGQTFTFTNYSSPVCGYVADNYRPAIDCLSQSDNYIFADDVHPTDMAHRLLSLVVEQEIQQWK